MSIQPPDRPFDHSALQALLGTFALHAIEGPEAEVVELHLRDCPSCRTEVGQHREVAALLGNVGGPAPELLWSRIAAQLEDGPPEFEVGSAPLAPSANPTGGRRRRLLGRGPVAAVVAAGLATVGVLSAQVHVLGDRTSALSRASTESRLAQSASAALLDPAARRVELRSAHGDQSLHGVLLPNGTGYVVNSDLPTLSSRHTYELWAVSATHRVPLGVLGPQPHPTAFDLGPLPGASLLAVTVEPAGGVTSGHEPAVVWS